MLLSVITRDGTHEEIPDGFHVFHAEDLIKTTLLKKPIHQKDKVQMEFILRCAAVIRGKWNKVKMAKGKRQ